MEGFKKGLEDVRKNLVNINEQITQVTDRQFYQKAHETEFKREELKQVQTARERLVRAKKIILKVQKVEKLVEKQALLVALRELRTLKATVNSEEDLEHDLKQWVKSKLQTIKDSIIKTFKKQREKLVKDIEN